MVLRHGGAERAAAGEEHFEGASEETFDGDYYFEGEGSGSGSSIHDMKQLAQNAYSGRR